jgi:hypothetical protein
MVDRASGWLIHAVGKAGVDKTPPSIAILQARAKSGIFARAQGARVMTPVFDLSCSGWLVLASVSVAVGKRAVEKRAIRNRAVAVDARVRDARAAASPA